MSAVLWEDAWVLLAVKYAQGSASHATRRTVLEAGDFIQHAVPLDRELEHAARVLGESGLLCVDEDGFRLGPAFLELWSRSGAEKHRGAHAQLEKLRKALGAPPPGAPGDRPSGEDPPPPRRG